MMIKLWFFVSYKAQTRELSKFLGLLLFGQFSLLNFFQERHINWIICSMICFFGGRGLAYTRESDRDMKLVAVADRKRKKPKVAPSGLPDISK